MCKLHPSCMVYMCRSVLRLDTTYMVCYLPTAVFCYGNLQSAMHSQLLKTALIKHHNLIHEKD